MGCSPGLELLLEKVTDWLLRWSIMFPTTSPSIGKLRTEILYTMLLCHQISLKFGNLHINFTISDIFGKWFGWKKLNRHGVRQLRSGWFDGPSYITQCPIQTGQTYVYNFTIVGQRGTLWWHAHISWLRATVYGPLIILPKHNASYPFAKPYEEVPIIFGTY